MPEPTAQEPQVATGSAAAAGAPEPAVQGDDYEKRFKGLQPLYQREQQEKQKLAQQATEDKELLTQRDTRIQTLEEQLRQKETHENELTGKVKELEGSKTVLEAAVQKSKLIRSEFPGLVAFTDVIPTAEEEEAQRTLLTQWSGLISGEVDRQVKQQVDVAVAGVTPPASPARGAGMPSEEDLATQLEAAAGRNPAEFERLNTLWLEQES